MHILSIMQQKMTIVTLVNYKNYTIPGKIWLDRAGALLYNVEYGYIYPKIHYYEKRRDYK